MFSKGKQMKILHTSDWHLGARLHEEERAPEHQAFLEWLLGQIKAERPDALLWPATCSIRPRRRLPR